jgi:hypothetical protein
MSEWTTTTDTRLAAAIGCLDIPIRPAKVLDERTGRRLVRYHLGLASACGTFRTKELQHALKDDQLPPAHPLRVMLRACIARERLLDFANRGERCSLRPVEGAPGLHHYEPSGDGLPGLVGIIGPVFRTGDLKLVTALGTIGLSILHIEGPAGRRDFYLPARGTGPRPGGFPTADALELKKAWLADRSSIPWEDPFAQAMRVLWNRERLLDVVNGSADLVLLSKGKKKATLLSTATDAAWEKAEDFLG